MALIECDECGKKVSDKASSCPHCGNPIKLEETYSDKEHEIVTVKSNLIIIIFLCLCIIAGFVPLTKTLYETTSLKLYSFIPIIIIIFICIIIIFNFKSCYITLTNKRIKGQHIYGLRKTEIDYPLRQIKNITSVGILGISSFTVSVGMSMYTIPFAINGKKLKKEYFNLIENKYKY